MMAARPLPKSTKDIPLVEEQFKLPSVKERLETFDCVPLVERAFAVCREERDEYLQNHARDYGTSRDHAVLYSQKTHDQIQGQIRGLYLELLMGHARAYARLEAAFERIEQLETDRLAYEGVWQARTYSKGSLVTWGGSCWHANKETDAKPGDDDREAWTLMVKKGRDGKDFRNVAE